MSNNGLQLLSELIKGEKSDFTIPTSASEARRVVPFFYRAIDIRAKTLVQVPWALWREGEDVTDEDTFETIVEQLPDMFYRIEASLSLEGAAYCGIISNEYGYNARLQWYAPQTITPEYNPRTGTLTHYIRTNQNGSDTILPENMIAIWYPDPYTEVSPGLAPIYPAMKSAGVLASLDEFSRLFFQRGALKEMLLQVEKGASKDQMAKLEAWWNRIATGISNAWRSTVISEAVTPVIVGGGLDDIDIEKIITPRRQDILAACGVPESLVTNNEASYATARQHRLTFLQSTIVPDAKLIASAMNKQFFSRLGVALEFDETLMEEYQASELEKVLSLMPLFDAGIISKEEVREALGWLNPDPEAGLDTDAMRAWKTAYDAAWENY